MSGAMLSMERELELLRELSKAQLEHINKLQQKVARLEADLYACRYSRAEREPK